MIGNTIKICCLIANLAKFSRTEDNSNQHKRAPVQTNNRKIPKNKPKISSFQIFVPIVLIIAVGSVSYTIIWSHRTQDLMRSDVTMVGSVAASGIAQSMTDMANTIEQMISPDLTYVRKD